IASHKTPDEIREHLNVDSVGYLSLEGMLGSLGPDAKFCSACFSGDYPTPLSDLERGHAAAGV
ncbi:MAG TPA: hypothetical protein VFI91_07760, partial [Longimicrobiaceae bacterium]|nr:hypothetical protein [Longimicrobiaceae bacterium]